MTRRRWGRRRTISAATTINADRWSAYVLLSDFDQHWRFAGTFVDVLALEGPPDARTGGLLRLRGPFGIRRVVSTRLLAARAPTSIAGQATAGRKTAARITWRLAASSSGTTAELSVTVLRAGLLDRVLLGLGRHWLRRQLEGTLRRFAAAATEEAPDQDRRVA